MDFMRNWTFSANGREPIRVDLPHDAMLLEKRTYATPNGDKTGYYPGGKYEYTNSKGACFRKGQRASAASL